MLEQPCVLNCYRRVHIPTVRRCQYLAGTMTNERTNECKLRLKCDGTRAETKFRLSAKRTSPFKSAGASVQSTTGNRGVRISGSNAGYTMFRGSVKSTGYLLHSPVSSSLPLPCVTVCHHISTGLYLPWCFSCCMFQQNRIEQPVKSHSFPSTVNPRSSDCR